MFDTKKAIKNKFDELATHVLDGKSVSIFLSPNEQEEDELGLGPYIESVELPHILVRDRMVWAGQERNVGGVSGTSLAHTSGYIYCNANDMFLNYRMSDEQLQAKTPNISILLLSTAHYSELNWHIHDDYDLVWEERPKQGKERIVEAIRRGAKFKIALQDEKDFWHIHPVYYPFYYAEKDMFEFHTHLGAFPNIIQETPEQVDSIWKQANGQFHDPETRRALREKVAASNTGFWFKFKIRDNGYYQTIDDEKNGRRRQYKRLKIFASKMAL